MKTLYIKVVVVSRKSCIVDLEFKTIQTKNQETCKLLLQPCCQQHLDYFFVSQEDHRRIRPRMSHDLVESPLISPNATILALQKYTQRIWEKYQNYRLEKHLYGYRSRCSHINIAYSHGKSHFLKKVYHFGPWTPNLTMFIGFEVVTKRWSLFVQIDITPNWTSNNLRCSIMKIKTLNDCLYPPERFIIWLVVSTPLKKY